MDIFNANSIEKNFPINVCRCCLAEGCYKDISSEYFISGKKEVYEEMLKDVFNLEISYQKYGGPSCHSRLICENCIGKLRDAKEFKYKVLASEKSFIKFLDDMQINVKEEENIEEADILAEECVIKLEPELNTDNDVESCENDALENSEVVNFVVDVMGVKLESESNTDSEIESHETLENHTERNHTETFENIKLQLKKDLNKLLPGGANVCDKRKLTTEGNTKTKKPRRADEGTNGLSRKCDYELSEKTKSVLPANATGDILVNILNETEDFISFEISQSALMPGGSKSDKGDLSKGNNTSQFVSSSNEVDNLFKERDILDGSNNIALSLEKVKHPLSEDFHDTNIPKGKDKPPKAIVLAKVSNEKCGSKKKFETKQSNSNVKSMKRKSIYCLFCQTFVLNYSRHMVLNHSAEPEIKRALATPKGSLERKNIFKALRARGNIKIYHAANI